MDRTVTIATPVALWLSVYMWPTVALTVIKWLLMVWIGLVLVDAAIAYLRAWSYRSQNGSKRVAVVTGASAGLGKEIATLLARQDYFLLLVARRESLLQELQRDLQQLTKFEVFYVVADLATTNGINKVVDHITKHQLQIDLLVNNAGASVRQEMTSLTPTQVDQILQLNVVAATKLTHALVPGMVARGRGDVLMISSMAGEMPNPLAAIYGASKSFLTKFALAINYELRGTGVQVTTFLPGPLHTEFGQHAQCQDAIYMNLPGRATPHECAQVALAAMKDRTTEFAFDTWATWLMTTTMNHIVPRTLSTTLAGLSMEDPMALVHRMRGTMKKD